IGSVFMNIALRYNRRRHADAATAGKKSIPVFGLFLKKFLCKPVWLAAVVKFFSPIPAPPRGFSKNSTLKKKSQAHLCALYPLSSVSASLRPCEDENGILARRYTCAGGVLVGRGRAIGVADRERAVADSGDSKRAIVAIY